MKPIWKEENKEVAKMTISIFGEKFKTNYFFNISNNETFKLILKKVLINEKTSEQAIPFEEDEIGMNDPLFFFGLRILDSIKTNKDAVLKFFKFFPYDNSINIVF